MARKQPTSNTKLSAGNDERIYANLEPGPASRRRKRSLILTDMLIPLTRFIETGDLEVRPTFPKTLRGFAIGSPMSRGVCAIFGRADGQKAFAARVVEAAGIGRLKAVHCGNAISATTRFLQPPEPLMHRSRFPLKEWFWVAYLVATHTPA